MRDLRELIADPARVAEWTPEDVAAALSGLAAVQAALAAGLRANPVQPTTNGHPPTEDRLLTPEQAALRFGVTRNWLYRHWRSLPFARKLSPKVLRFSEAGLNRYLAKKGP